MFSQVGNAGLAKLFISGAHLVPDLVGYQRSPGFPENQDQHAVFQAVFHDLGKGAGVFPGPAGWRKSQYQEEGKDNNAKEGSILLFSLMKYHTHHHQDWFMDLSWGQIYFLKINLLF
jgi:hypothetical protein